MHTRNTIPNHVLSGRFFDFGVLNPLELMVRDTASIAEDGFFLQFPRKFLGADVNVPTVELVDYATIESRDCPTFQKLQRTAKDRRKKFVDVALAIVTAQESLAI